jgi:hypothetical protein
VANPSVSGHHQNEILRPLDALRQQTHRRAGLLKLGALRGNLCDEQRQDRDDCDRRREMLGHQNRYAPELHPN